MSVNEDYAGGSYKSNGELESDIETLRDEVSGLGAEISELKELIRQMMDLNVNRVDLVQTSEVVQTLATWVNEDEG